MAILETDPLDIKLNADGDIDIDPELGMTFVSGLEGVMQLVGVILRLYKGEWFWDEEEGVPWFQTILGEKFDRATLYDALLPKILETVCVTGVDNFAITFDNDTRKARVSGIVRTQFGDSDLDEEFP